MSNELGELIRQTRKQMKLTLRELSKRTGMSVSQLSKLENGKQRISVEMALKLAAVMEVPVTSFLAIPRRVPQARRTVTRAGTAAVHETDGMRFEVLCSDFRDKSNFFWNVTVTGRSLEETGGWRSHSGEEFIQVLTGKLELHTRHYDPLVLEEGDSVLFDGEMDHGYVNLADSPTVLFMSNATINAQQPELPADPA